MYYTNRNRSVRLFLFTFSGSCLVCALRPLAGTAAAVAADRMCSEVIWESDAERALIFGD